MNLTLLVAIAFVAVASVLWTLTPTNRYMNTSGWGFTPTGGSAVNITGVTSASYDEGISQKKEGADFDVYATVTVTDFHEPKITLETIDSQTLYSAVAGILGTLAGTIRDAKNGASAGGGGKIYTLSNAQIEGRSFNAPYRDYSKATLVFGAISTDGATDPLAVTAA